MFNEYFNPPPSVVSLVRAVIAPRPADTTGTPLSTSNDQDAPAASTSSTTQETQSLVLSEGVEELLRQAPLEYDIFLDILTSEPRKRSFAFVWILGDVIITQLVDACLTTHEMWEAIERLHKDRKCCSNKFGTSLQNYFKKIYKPTNNNLRTSSNTRNKNVDTTLRYKNDNQTGLFRNQRIVTVAGARETVGGQVVQQTRIQCFNYKEFGHFSKECKKPKRVKDSTYHKEKMLLCKQAEKGVQLQVDYMAKIQEVPTADSGTDSEPLEQNDQNAVECDDERVVLANLITKFERYKTLNNHRVDYEKLKHKLNETLGLLAQKYIDIKEGLKLKAYEILVVKEKHDELVKQSLLTKSHYEGLVKEKTKVITYLNLKEEKDIDKMISMEKQLKFLNEIVYKMNQSIQTIHMLAPKFPTFNGRPTFANPMYLKKAQYEKPSLYEIPHNQFDATNRLVPDREETLTLKIESRSKFNKDLVRPYDYTKLNSLYENFKPPTQEYLVQLAHANEVRKKM
ncbi:retrovirus-related pol polyprotein from transposon TNT 1-94 [Tanacetum coccineum]